MAEHKLLNELSVENLDSYAEACISLFDALEGLMKSGFTNLVIPSRGAYPFYSFATSIAKMTMRQFLDFHLYHTGMKVLLLPFTSDWGDATVGLNSAKARGFWVKILNDILNQRISPHTIYYESIVNQLGGRFKVNNMWSLPGRFYQGNNATSFVFLDTIVSGQAICEIITSFKEQGITDYFVIGIADNDGAGIKAEYNQIIHAEIAAGRMKLIRVKRIFSEDTSPLLNTGICSMVFPSLIQMAYDQIPDFQKDGLVGGGLWFIDVMKNLYGQPIYGVRGIALTLVDFTIRGKLIDPLPHFEEFAAHEVQHMVDISGEYEILDGETTKRIVFSAIADDDGNIPNDSFDVTSSHVVRVTLEEDYALKFIEDVNNKIEDARKNKLIV
jgi:hypothetical protein